MTSPTPSPEDGLDAVRARFAAPEDVDMGDVPIAGEGAAVDGEDPGYDSEDPGPQGPGEGGPPGDAGSSQEGEPAQRCVELPLNDFGNGQRMRVHFGEDLRFVPRIGWYTWTGQRWQHDQDALAVTRQAQELGRLVAAEIPHIKLSDEEEKLLGEEKRLRREKAAAEAAGEGDRVLWYSGALVGIGVAQEKAGKRRKERLAHARGSGNAAKVKAALEMTQPLLDVALEALDADPLVINTESGMLRAVVDDMGEEGGGRVARLELVPHAREQLLTKIIPCRWVPGAKAPLFEAFLARVQPAPHMRDFLQRWLGLSMTGLTGEQKLAFLYGSGANGKSVLMDLMARIMGDYAATAKIESLTGQNRRSGGDATPDLVPLIGARLVRASEPEEGERLQEGRIKELTGGEPILVRSLNKDFVEVRPKFKLTISGNHRPEIRGGDDGIWRRILLVPFDVQIPAHERDPLLVERLWAERDGILQWLAAGLADYLEGGLREPAEVVEATAEYREESDPLGRFLVTACVVTGDPEDAIRTAELVAAYNYWLLEQGSSQWKPRTIENGLSGKSKMWRHPSTGAQIHKGKSSLSQYEGVRLSDVFRRRFEAAPRNQEGRATGVAAPSDEAPW